MGGASIITYRTRRGKQYAVAVYAGLDPTTKTRRYKWTRGFKTHRAAEEFRSALAHHPAFSAGAGPYGEPRLRVAEFLQDYLRDREANHETRSLATNERMVRLYLTPHLGHIPLSRLGPRAIQHMYQAMLRQPRKNLPKKKDGEPLPDTSQNGRPNEKQEVPTLSAATVVRAAGVLHAALERAIKQGLIVRNPMESTTLPPVPAYRPRVPAVADLLAYLNDAAETATPALMAFYTVLAECGPRPGELLGAPENAFDPEAQTLHLYQDLEKAGADPEYGEQKTSAAHRILELSDPATAIVRDAVLWKKEQRLKVGSRFRDSGLLFVGEYGRPLNLNNIRHRDHLPRLKRLGLPRSRPYDLRHFSGTFQVGEGVDYRTVSSRLGHKRPSFTLDRYVWASTRGQERAVAAANNLLIKLKRFAK